MVEQRLEATSHTVMRGGPAAHPVDRALLTRAVELAVAAVPEAAWLKDTRVRVSRWPEFWVIEADVCYSCVVDAWGGLGS